MTSNKFQFNINPSSPTAIYEQIVREVRNAIANKELKAGQYLPGTRAVAKEQGIATGTVEKAYRRLSSEGIVRAVPGKGMMVADCQEAEATQAQLDRLRSITHEFIRRCRHAGLDDNAIQELVEQGLKGDST